MCKKMQVVPACPDVSAGTPCCRCLQDFHRVWSDEAARLTLWEPVPPRGYCSLGLVATTDQRAPPTFAAFCVRDNAMRLSEEPPHAVTRLRIAGNEFLATAQQAHTISLCSYDRQTLALQKRSPSEEQQPCLILDQPKLQAVQPPGAAAAAVPTTVHLGTGSVCLRVRNILRVPLLEAETAGVDAECEMLASGVVRASANWSPEVWAYNAALKAWEPVVEKFAVKVRAALAALGPSAYRSPRNSTAQQCSLCIAGCCKQFYKWHHESRLWLLFWILSWQACV